MTRFSAPSKSEHQESILHWLSWILVPIFLLTGIILRWKGLHFVSFDMTDFLIGWYDKLAKNGFSEFRSPFSNYTPPYLYLLFLMTKTAGLIPKVVAIKLPAIVFDFLNAVLVYKVLRIKYPQAQGEIALIGASAFLLLPTIWLNSAYWGQADSIYSFYLLACLFFLLKDKPLVAMIFLGLSFSLKAQAVFLAPLILLLVIRKRIPWFSLLIIPVIYVLMTIPAALTGRSFTDLLTIYAAQAETYAELSLHAPNLYYFFPASLSNPIVALIGTLITGIIALAWITTSLGKIKEFTAEVILSCALTSVAFMPFFLPRMHERYFYLADCISFLVAFYFPRGWLLAVGYQLVSILTYSVFLFFSVRPVGHAVARNLLITAVFVNTALISYLFSNQWDWISPGPKKHITLNT